LPGCARNSSNSAHRLTASRPCATRAINCVHRFRSDKLRPSQGSTQPQRSTRPVGGTPTGRSRLAMGKRLILPINPDMR
jgi:hypothetical protein